MSPDRPLHIGRQVDRRRACRLFLPERFGQVPGPAVGKDRHDDAPADSLCDIAAGGEYRAARNADQPPLFRCQPPHHLVRILGTDPQVVVRDARIVDAGDDGRLHVLEPLDAVERGVGLHRDQADTRHLGAQAPGDARERPARPEPRDEVRDPAAGLGEDLRAGRVVVRPPVGIVVVLIRIEIAVGLGLIQPARLADRAVGSFHRVRQHQLGAVCKERALPLDRHVRGNAELHADAERGADHRVRDAGVPRRRIEQDLPGPEGAGSLTLGDHPRRSPVLHRPSRIQPLGLREDLDAGDLAVEQADP